MIEISFYEVNSKKHELAIAPVGSAYNRVIVQEKIEQNFPDNGCHDGGWETIGSFFYIVSAKSLSKKLSEIVSQRIEEGWQTKEQSKIGELPFELSLRKGDANLHIRYLAVNNYDYEKKQIRGATVVL